MWGPMTKLIQQPPDRHVVALRHTAGLLAAALAAALGLLTADASAQATWTGGGSSTNWSDAANWSGTAPTNGGSSVLTFDGSTGLSNTNNLTNVTLTSGTFTTSGFTLGGNAVTLGGPLTNNAATGTNAINFNMTVAAARTITGVGGSTLAIGGTVSGAGGFTTGRTGTTGTPTFILSGNNTMSGQTTLSASTRLVLGHANALGTGELRFRGGFLDISESLTVTSPVWFDPSGGTSTFQGTAALALTGPVKIGTGNVPISVSANTLTLKSLENYPGIATALTLSKSGSGTLVITDAAQAGFTRSSVTVSGGILRIGNGAALGSGTVTLTSGTLQTSADVTIANAIAADGGFVGGTTNFTLGSAISGSGTFNKIGTNTVTLSATNLHTGITGVAGGVLLLDTNSALPGGIGATGGTSNLALGLVGQTNDGVLGLKSGTFARATGLGASQVNMQYGGGFAAYGAGVAVNLGGASAQIRWGTATNFLTDSAAILVLGAADATDAIDFQNPLELGSLTGVTTRTIKVNDGLAAVDAIMSGAIVRTTSGTVTGFTKSGLGTLALTATNTYPGATTISQGTLQVGNNGTTGSIQTTSPVSVASGAAFAFHRSDDVSYGGTVSGAGGFRKLGAGTLTLTATNSYAGPTTVLEGVLQVGNGSTSGSIADSASVAVATGAELAFARSDAITFAGVVSGQGGLGKFATGSLTLPSANSYSGPTTIRAGTLVAANSRALGTGTVTINAGASLRIDQDSILTNAITNAGTISFAGGGLQRTSTAGLATVSQLLAGSMGSAVTLDPAFAWTARIEGTTVSDVLDLTGTSGTAQMLSLTYAPAGIDDLSRVFLGWLDTRSSTWVNAVEGNDGGTSTFFAGSWSEYLAATPGATIADSLGVYGRDTRSDTVWAVVNHNSQFASIIVVPEPGTLALAAAAGLAAAWAVRPRRRRPA
jgi:fibronectin-binding autotransporter adhesin